MSLQHNTLSTRLAVTQQSKNHATHPLPSTSREIVDPSQNSTKQQQQQQQQREKNSTSICSNTEKTKSNTVAVILQPTTQTHLESSSQANEAEIVKKPTANTLQSTVIIPQPSSPPSLPMIECTGCHRLQQVTVYIEDEFIYKSCERCRTSSKIYYKHNFDRIRQRKYARKEMFQCRCGSKVKMYCKPQHFQSIRQQNWQELQDAEVSDNESEYTL